MSAKNNLRAAATVMVLREQNQQLQVLMIKRAATLAFASHVWAFPGGGVHEADYDSHWACQTPDVNIEERAHRVAALRETFEETGLLLIAGDLAPQTLSIAADWQAARAQVSAQASLFTPWLRAQNLRLDLANMQPFSRWIPPEDAPRRYDTRFYLASADPQEALLADGQETEALAWVNPAHMLKQYQAGAQRMIFPTLMNLMRLNRAHSVAEAYAQAHVDGAATIHPWVQEISGVAHLCIPEHAGYPITQMPLSEALRG
jgi:8-oxo-dGTP pyrophosphatase MutT (NUDIX family)